MKCTYCDSPAWRKEMCVKHFMRWYKHGSPLWEPAPTTNAGKHCLLCDQPARSKGWCQKHYARWYRNGETEITNRREYRSGGLDKDGYLRLSVNGKHILEHRLVMERHLKRPLRKDEAVHHMNGNRLDNRIENLQLMTHSEHASHHGHSKPCKLHCKKGHAFTPENTKTFKRPNGTYGRQCKICQAAWFANYHAQKRLVR